MCVQILQHCHPFVVDVLPSKWAEVMLWFNTDNVREEINTKKTALFKAGLGLGSLIGGGTGHDVAMVLGALGGAVAGHEVQNKYDKPVPGQQIIIRIKNGVLVSVTQPVKQGLSKGQAVYVEGSGKDARVLPQ